MRIPCSFAAIVCLSTFAIACGTDTPQRHLDRAERYMQEQNYAEAAVEYRVALSLSPQNGDAHAKLARAYGKLGDIRSAYRELLKAADLSPDRPDIQLETGQLLLAAGRFEEAKKRARAVLEKDRNNVAAVVLLGNALVGLKDFDNAADLGKRAVELDPERGGTYRNLGVLELIRGHADSAEAAFRHALEIDPKSVSAYLALANLYRATGARAKAEDIYKQALSLDADDVLVNQALGSFYIEWDRASEAESYLRRAAEHSPDLDATLALADYYLGMGKLDQAKATLTKPLSTKEGFGPASIRAALIEYVSGNKAGGHQFLDEAIKKEPRNALALAMKARLLLSDLKVDEAFAMAEAAAKMDPRAVEPKIILGRVQLVRHDTEGARRSFNDALTLDHQNIDAQLALAKLHLDRGEIPTALDYAQQGVKSHPSSLEAQLLVVQAIAAHADEIPKAEAALDEIARRFPNAPQVSLVKGNIAYAQHDTAGARKAWERTLTLDPDNVDALGGLAALLAATGKPVEARRLVDGRVDEHPKNPGLLMLGAKVRIVSRDTKGAEDLLKRALEIDATNLQAYTLLGQIYVSEHRVEEAQREFSQVIRQVPGSMEAHTMMGLLSESQKDPASAISWYDRALQLNPRAAVAANNLAWIYATQNDNLDTALKLAQAATTEMPNQPEFQDTLGWVYYNNRQTSLAIAALQTAIRLAPTNPIYRFHLGMAYAQDGSDSKARRELEAALKLDPALPQAVEARKTIASLVY